MNYTGLMVSCLVGSVTLIMLYFSGVADMTITIFKSEVNLNLPTSAAFAVTITIILYDSLKSEGNKLHELMKKNA